MLKKEIEIGGKYKAKVSNKIATVQIMREHSSKGWIAKNVATGREIHIRSAQRLRHAAGGKWVILGDFGDHQRYLTEEPRWVPEKGQAKKFNTMEDGRAFFHRMAGYGLEATKDTRLEEVAK